MFIGIVGALAILIGGLWVFQRRLIYFPEGDLPPVASILSGWEDVRLETSDGLELGAWYRAPPPDGPVLVVFNGNAGNRAGRATLGSRFAAEGFGVLLFDYRGYGGNPGSPTEAGLARDARAAARFVTDRSPGHPVVYYGESLGAAVAVELATAKPPSVIILRSPFTSLPDVASVHYPFLPVDWLLKDDYPSLDRITSVGGPLLVVAGSDDATIPLAQSRALFEAADEPKAMVVIDGADHNDSELATGPQLLEAAVDFIAEHSAP